MEVEIMLDIYFLRHQRLRQFSGCCTKFPVNQSIMRECETDYEI